ncbi:MAG: hypothetical protein JWO45_1034 [Spartobacteria bacterium]|nr:hypothetical protein [Spartobacteria bacterium]
MLDGVCVAVGSGVCDRGGVTGLTEGVALGDLCDISGVGELASVTAEDSERAVADIVGDGEGDAEVEGAPAAGVTGFTKVLGGASGGGVASARIFARTLTVWESEIDSQPWSITGCEMVCLIARGRCTRWARSMTGAVISITWPLRTGRCASVCALKAT